MHGKLDLKVCYDRKLPNVRCVMQEAAGINREASKVFAKLLPITHYHVHTDFSHRHKIEALGRTG